MTETSLASPPEQIPAHPADVLMQVIITLLAPMFLTATNGDIGFARMAAFETIDQYRPKNHIDLIAIAQIIAGSLTALSSASLALTDNLPLAMVRSFRANAVALNRVVEQARRALRASQSDNRVPGKAFVPNPNQAQYEAQVAAELAIAQQSAAEALARYEAEDTAAAPAPIEPPPPTPKTIEPPPPAPKTITATGPAATPHPITDEEWQARWASAMTDVGQEFTAELQNLPPAERELASRRVAALASAARQLLSGDVPPRPRPGDLESLIKP